MKRTRLQQRVMQKEVAIPYVVMGLTNELAEVFEKVDNAAEAKEIMKEVGDVL